MKLSDLITDIAERTHGMALRSRRAGDMKTDYMEYDIRVLVLGDVRSSEDTLYMVESIQWDRAIKSMILHLRPV